MNQLSDDDRALLIRVDTKLDLVSQRVEKVESDVSEIKAQANKWRGGLAVIFAFGGVITVLVSLAVWLLNSLKGLFS